MLGVKQGKSGAACVAVAGNISQIPWRRHCRHFSARFTPRSRVLTGRREQNRIAANQGAQSGRFVWKYSMPFSWQMPIMRASRAAADVLNRRAVRRA
jgi:hypothetical protein